MRTRKKFFSLPMSLKPGITSQDEESHSKHDSQFNIFQAILFQRLDLLNKMLDTSTSDYVFHIKSTDSLGRYNHSEISFPVLIFSIGHHCILLPSTVTWRQLTKF